MEKIVDVGDGLSLCWAAPDELREQDLNPQVMEPTMFRQLTGNVQRRGALESVPFCAIPKGKTDVEIVSGHKRIRAAREAQLERIVILLDTSGLTRSAVAAKLLAHNNISGHSDPEVMAMVAAEIETVDDKLEAYLPKELENAEPQELEPLLTPKLDLQWKTVTLAFLPAQLADFKALIETVQGRQDLVAAADVGLFNAFIEALSAYSRFQDVRSANQAVAMMVKAALDAVKGDADTSADDETAMSLAAIFGGLRIPASAGKTIQAAVQQMMRDGVKLPWQALEQMAHLVMNR